MNVIKPMGNLAIQSVLLRSSKASRLRPVSWLELFFDLIFVAAVAQVGEPLVHDYTLAGVARYAFLFVLIWWAWLGHTMFSTRFESDDIIQRLLTILQVFAVAVMAANAKEALSTRDAAGFAAAYAIMRLILVAQYFRARGVHQARRLATIHCFGFGIAASLWLAAALFDAPLRFFVWGLALAIDLSTPLFAAHYTHKLPPDAAHAPERHGLFTIILLGESVAGVMRGIESQDSWGFGPASSAILGLCLAFCYWWWYFDHSAAAEERHVDSKRKTVLFYIWSYFHFPLYLAIAVSSVGVRQIISTMHGERLDPMGTRILLYSAAVAMISMLTIGSTSTDSRSSNRRRLTAAFAVAVVPAIAAIFAPAFPTLALPPGLLFLCVLTIRLTSEESQQPLIVDLRHSKAAPLTRVSEAQ